MLRRLSETYAAAPPEVRKAGRDWYRDAEAEVVAMAARYGLPPHAVAGVIAALSPQTRWRFNLDNAEAILERRPLPHATYTINERKASEIANGSNPLDVLGGPKVRAFFANLLGIEEAVTVDVWAQRAAYGRDLPAPKSARYGRVAKAYQAAAKRAGIPPRDFQATVWLSVRPSSEHTRDQNRNREVFA